MVMLEKGYGGGGMFGRSVSCETTTGHVLENSEDETNLSGS